MASVWRWDEPTSIFVKHTCGLGPNNFTLSRGIAYGVVNASGQTIKGLLVGTHDDTFSYSIAATAGSNLTWVSVPYHQAIPDVAGSAGVVDAEDLCRSVGPAATAVLHWDRYQVRHS